MNGWDGRGERGPRATQRPGHTMAPAGTLSPNLQEEAHGTQDKPGIHHIHTLSASLPVCLSVAVSVAVALAVSVSA